MGDAAIDSFSVPKALGLVLVSILSTLCALLFGLAVYLRLNRKSKTIGIFHPYCDAGGGGERVLFCAVKYLPKDWKIVIYTGDHADGKAILDRCKMRFGEGSTPLDNEDGRISFIHLRTRFLVEASTWPRFTLIGQSLGSIILGLEALLKLSPEVYLDTMGFAFTFPAAKWLCGSRVGCYVHYPTISGDMLNKVFERRPSYNNSARIAGSRAISLGKYLYYKAFSMAYGWVGGLGSSCTMVNSTWTKNHIDKIWKTNATLVFPPCLSSDSLRTGPKKQTRDESLMISIGQFRPEKDHRLQLASLKRFKDLVPAKHIKLVLVGSCRGKEDRDRIEDLKRFALVTLQLEEGTDFEFKVDATKQEVDDLYGRALIGLHTMWNEHFGIGVVEMMAAGVLVIAHDSGGPKFDIVRNAKDEETRTGFLANDDDSYARAMRTILQLNEDQREATRLRARDHIKQFTEEEFGRAFVKAVQEKLLL